MANPIPLELPRRDPREELRVRLEQAPVDHAEAVLAGFEVLQGLHDQGVLEMLRGILGGSDKILELAVAATRTPEAIRGIRNLLIMAKMIGSVDPELLEKFARAFPDALAGAAKAQETDPPGFFGVLRTFRSSNLRRGLAVVNSLLEAWGKNFAIPTSR
jgi:uncharacterized protein YjgD (DUF1641 family)